MSTDQGDGNPKPPFHVEGGIPIFDRLNEVEREQTESKKRDKEYKAEQLSLDRSMVRFTGLLVICTAIVGGINGWQAHIANRSARAAENATKTAAESVTKAQAAIDLSKEQFQKQFQLTKDQFQRDQRPYIWNTQLELPRVKVGDKVTWNFRYMNFGKSPSIGLAFRCQILLAAHKTRQKKNLFSLIHNPKYMTEGFITPPGDSSGFSTCESDETATQEDIDMRKIYDATVVIKIFYEYSDTSGNAYTSRVCLFLRRIGTSPIGICPTENEIR